MKILKLITFMASFLVIQACNSNKPIHNNMRLYVLDCGEITVKDISLFSPGVDVGQSKKLTNSCYLITHPQGNFIWDTGLNDELVKMTSGIEVAEGMFHLKVTRTLESQLAEIGLSPNDINYVALSHFHFDHTGNMNLFSKAKFLVQEEELKIAFSENAREMHFDPETYQLINKDKFVGLVGDHDVFNDGKLRIVSSPGHTPGHQSLLINLVESGAILLSGDLFHFTKNRVNKRVPALNFDKMMTLQSIENVEGLLNNVQGQIWIQHDYEAISALKHLPEYYQ